MSDLMLTMDVVPGLPGGIGLFDSGVGGLTVLNPLLLHEPRWPTVAVADQAHVPYGGRPLEQIRQFALAQTECLFGLGVDQVVMACNVSSATALAEARQRFGTARVWGMVELGCDAAKQATRAGRVAVLATEGTVRSRAYDTGLEALGLQPRSIPCPKFVPLVEAGELDGPETDAAIDEALSQVRAHRADTVILGCTHYPFLLPRLEARAPDLTFVDPGSHVVPHIVASVSDAPVAPWISTTGEVEQLKTQVASLYRGPTPPRLAAAQWGRQANVATGR